MVPLATLAFPYVPGLGVTRNEGVPGSVRASALEGRLQRGSFSGRLDERAGRQARSGVRVGYVTGARQGERGAC